MGSKENKHVFLVFTNFGLGGVQRKMVDIVNHIAASDHYKNIIAHVVVKRNGEFCFSQFLNSSPRIKYHSCPNLFDHKFGNICFSLKITYLFIRFRPVSILSFFHYSLPYLLILKIISVFKLRIVIGQDNILSLYNKKENMVRFYPNWLIKILLLIPDKLIAQTNFAKQDLIDNYNVSDSKIEVIPNWVVDTENANTKKKYDLIYCGRFVRQKRIDRIINIFYQVNKILPQTNLCLIGSGSEEKKLRIMISNLDLEDKVIIRPPTIEVKKEINRSKIFILTSAFEGHPMVMLEAMMLGAIPVVLDYPGVNEYLDHKKTGYIEKNTEGIIKRIVDLLKYKRKRTIYDQARKTVMDSYNSTLIDKTISVILNSKVA